MAVLLMAGVAVFSGADAGVRAGDPGDAVVGAVAPSLLARGEGRRLSLLARRGLNAGLLLLTTYAGLNPDRPRRGVFALQQGRPHASRKRSVPGSRALSRSSCCFPI